MPLNDEMRQQLIEAARQGEDRGEDHLQLGQVVRGAERRCGQEQHERRSEQREQQHLAPEERLDGIAITPH